MLFSCAWRECCDAAWWKLACGADVSMASVCGSTRCDPKHLVLLCKKSSKLL